MADRVGISQLPTHDVTALPSDCGTVCDEAILSFEMDRQMEETPFTDLLTVFPGNSGSHRALEIRKRHLI